MIAEFTRHLWQSTCFVLAVALLMLAFRGNRAQVRYWLWLSASVKFLLPFALLMSVGSRLQSWVPATQKIAPPVVSFAEEYVAQPFPATLSFVPAASRGTDWIFSILLGLWACGFLTIALIRFRSWLRIRAAVHAGTATNIHTAVEVRVTAGLLEPGVVGLLRPILLLPEGIAERLTPSELKAVLAHELCHVRRRDNLFAAIHMVVETVFWFHPLVWWIGVRLVEERERACDEEVLQQGNAADVYADAILNVCKLYVESPLTCIAGVSGASIRRRIEVIMSNRRIPGLNYAKKLLLASAGVVALVGPVVVGLVTGVGNAPAIHAQSSTPQPPAPVQPAQVNTIPPRKAAPQLPTARVPKFDAASIKRCDPSSLPPDGPGVRSGGAATGQSPDRLTFRCTAVIQLITTAYSWHVDSSSPLYQPRIEGNPDWTMPRSGERYSIEAEAEGSPGQELMRGPMLQALLEDRFKLRLHREIRQVPVYELTAPKGAAKLQPFQAGRCVPHAELPSRDEIAAGTAAEPPIDSICRDDIVRQGPNVTMKSGVMDMDDFAAFIKSQVDRPVINQTGITGLFDFHLDFAPEVVNSGLRSYVASDDPPGQSIFTALESQLGLKLVSGTGAHGYIVIDHIERPSEN